LVYAIKNMYILYKGNNNPRKMAFSTFNSIQSFLMYVRASVSNLAFTYNFPALDPSLVLYYPMDSSANVGGGFKTANFASRLPVYDASLAGSSMITYALNNSVTSFGDLSLNNTMGAQLVAQTTSGNYVVANNTFVPNISGGFSISLWFSCSGQLNKRGTLINLPYQTTKNGLEIDVSGTNMICSGYNVPVTPIVQITFLSQTVTNTGSLGTATIAIGALAAPTIKTGGGYSFNVCKPPRNSAGTSTKIIHNFGSLTNFSISFWIYWLGTDINTVWFSSDAAGVNHRIMGFGDGLFMYRTFATTGGTEPSFTIPTYSTTHLNKWVHYVVTNSIIGTTGTINFYQNGTSIFNATNLNMTYHPGLGYIWNFPDSSNYFVYKYAIYNTTLTSSQVTTIFQNA